MRGTLGVSGERVVGERPERLIAVRPRCIIMCRELGLNLATFLVIMFSVKRLYLSSRIASLHLIQQRTYPYNQIM